MSPNQPPKELSPQWALLQGQLLQWLEENVPSTVTLERAAPGLCPAWKRTTTASLALEEKVSMAARNSASMTVSKT